MEKELVYCLLCGHESNLVGKAENPDDNLYECSNPNCLIDSLDFDVDSIL